MIRKTLFFLAVLVLSRCSWADTYSPDITWRYSHNLSKGFSSGSAACSDFSANHLQDNQATYAAESAYSGHCVADGANLTQVGAEMTCTQGGSLENNLCVKDCPSGTVIQGNGLCVKDCAGKSGQALPSPSYEFANDGGEQSVDGCAVTCKTNRSVGSELIPHVSVGEGCAFTGKAPVNGNGAPGTGFKPAPKDPKKPADCIGAGQGYIQSSTGSTTCVNSGDAPPGQKPKTTTTGEKVTAPTGTDGKPNPDAPTATGEKTTVTSSGGKTTTTKETTTNPTTDETGNPSCPSGSTLSNGKCVASVSTSEDTSDYCAKNPMSPNCKGTEEEDACIKNPERVGCADMGTPKEEGVLKEESKSILPSVSVVPFGGNTACPSNISLPKGASLSFEWPCRMADALRPLIIALAWLSAGLIVMGSFRS